MKTALCSLAIAMIAAVCMQTTTAQETATEKPCGKCPASAGAAMVSTDGEDCKCDGEKAGDCSTCKTADAMKELPTMTYKVGTEATCCADSAAKMAEESKAPIVYVVGTEEFETKDAAFVSLVEQTEAKVDEFVKPCKCEVSGTTTIAGEKCSCPIQAGETAEKVAAAVEQVKISYKVGEKSACCSASAKAMAESSGEELKYVVDGEESCCSMTARLAAARAKYKAAIDAVASKDSAEPMTETSGT